MSELAFNINGEAFDLPATATAWRVRRMKLRGAPEVVYSKDGVPLVVPIEAGLDELRQIVVVPGRYRLDAIDDRGKTVPNVPASYVIVPTSEPTLQAAISEFRTPEGGAAYVMAEAMRHNTELAKAVVDRFPQMVEAAASLLRAADGAGLPARPPRAVDDDEDDDGDEAAPAPAPAPAPAGDIYTMLSPILQMVAAAFMSGNLKVPDVGALFDWRKAKPAANKAIPPTTSDSSAEPAANDNANPSAPPAPAAPLPPIDPAAMAHVMAVQSALEPREVLFVQEVAKDLSPAELLAWFDKLGKLSVPEAVVVIRDLIAGKSKNGGAS